MGDFGTADYVLSSKGKQRLKIRLNEQQCYTFHQTKTVKTTSYYNCTECTSDKNSTKRQDKVPTVRVRDGTVLDDGVNSKNPHFCNPKQTKDVDGQQIIREASLSIKKAGKRPREAYNADVISVTEKLANNPEYRDEVETDMPTFKRARGSMYRSLASRYPVISDVSEIPEYLKQTFAGSKASDPGDRHFNEYYLIFEEHEPPFLVFMSDLDVQVLHGSSQIVADGSFKFRPSDIVCAQKYVIIGFVAGEAVPVVMALMPNRKESSYGKLFSTVRNKLVTNHGNIGNLAGGLINLDFEEGATSAFKSVFPEVKTQGCLFHYHQALNKNKDHFDLKAVYDQSNLQKFNLPQYSSVKIWIRRLGGLAFLPDYYIRPAFDRILSNPPVTGNGVVDQNFLRFRDYFVQEWMTPARISLISAYDNLGPRTTNHAEGTNNSYRSKFGEERPRLSVFLVHFQEIHHFQQVRIRQLQNGADSNPRRIEDIERDTDLARYKTEFAAAINNLYSAWSPNLDVALDEIILKFVNRCQRFM